MKPPALAHFGFFLFRQTGALETAGLMRAESGISFDFCVDHQNPSRCQRTFHASFTEELTKRGQKQTAVTKTLPFTASLIEPWKPITEACTDAR